MYDGLLKYKVKSQIYENASDLLYQLDSPQVKEKITKLLERYGDIFPYKTEDDVIAELKSNADSNVSRLLMCLLIKDPKKQNTSENEFFKFVNSGNSTYKVVKLPQTGKNAIVFGGCKALDFKIQGTDIIGTQKYTQGAGGAQDNQYRDVVMSLNYAKSNPQYKFIAVLDGDYYNNVRLKCLESSYMGCQNIKIMSADDFKSFLENGCIW